METLLFDTFVYLTAICVLCCLLYNPTPAEPDSDPDPWTLPLKPVQKQVWQPQPVLAFPSTPSRYDKSWTIRRLQAEAKRLQLKGYGRMSKTALIERLNQAL
jgi:hypothetical protein